MNLELEGGPSLCPWVFEAEFSVALTGLIDWVATCFRPACFLGAKTTQTCALLCLLKAAGLWSCTCCMIGKLSTHCTGAASVLSIPFYFFHNLWYDSLMAITAADIVVVHRGHRFTILINKLISSKSLISGVPPTLA